MSDGLNDPLVFADNFSSLPLDEIKKLEFENAAALIKAYVKDGRLALDYGCGPGCSTRFLKELGFKTDGVDINEHMLEKALELDPFGKYELIKSGEIPENSNHYDLVFACWVLMFISNKTELLQVCIEMARVLKKGGTLVAVVDCKTLYNIESSIFYTKFEENKKLYSGSVVKRQFKHSGFMVQSWYWTEDDYLEVLTKAGLTIVDQKRTVSSRGDNKNNNSASVSDSLKPHITLLVAQKL